MEYQTLVGQLFEQVGEKEDAIISTLRRGVEPVPYDAELQYLQSVSTGYINTGISYASNDKVRIVANGGSTVIGTNIHAFLGAADENNRLRVDGNIGRYPRCRFYAGTTYISDTKTRSTNVLAHFDVLADPIELTISGELNGTNYSDEFSGSIPSTTIYIFGSNNNGTHTYGLDTYIVGQVTFYRNDVLIADFIPVRVGQIGYFYDKVSKQLFGNAGTGDFILGPDKT